MRAKCDKCDEKLRKDVARSKKAKKLILYCPLCKKNYIAQQAFHVYNTPKPEKIKKAKQLKALDIVAQAKEEANKLLKEAHVRAENIIKQDIENYIAGKRDKLMCDIDAMYRVDLKKMESNIFVRAMDLVFYMQKTIEMIDKFNAQTDSKVFSNASQILVDYLNNPENYRRPINEELS